MSGHLAEVLDAPAVAGGARVGQRRSDVPRRGASIVRKVGAERVTVLPHVERVTGVCAARLGPGRHQHRQRRHRAAGSDRGAHLSGGRRILILSRDEHTPSAGIDHIAGQRIR